MSRIDELLAELCPDGVEFKELGEIALYAPTRIEAQDLDESNFVGVDNLLPNKAGRVDATHQPNTDRLARFEIGDVLFGNIRPYLRKVWLSDRSGGCSGDVLALRVADSHRERVLPTFLYYVMSSNEFFAYNMAHAKGAKMPRGDKAAILRYRIPVPPVAVQREIASVLDKMDNLRAELEAELEARSRQYAFYRDQLMDRELEHSPWRPIGEVGRLFRGKRFTKADYVEVGIPAIHYGEIYTSFGTATSSVVAHLRPELAPTLRFASPGDVVLVDVGETVEDVGKAVAWLGDQDVAIHDHCYVFRHEMDPSFVSYYMQTARFHADKAKHVARTKVKTLLMDGLARVNIPVPSLEEQRRIVAILDKFDALVNDLSSGLPAEIAARQKQYEYYRDKLLTFPEKTAS